MPALKVMRVTRGQVILIACAMLISLGGGLLLRAASSSAHGPKAQTMVPREREVVTALPASPALTAVGSIPQAVIEVAQRRELSLLKVRVFWGEVSRPLLTRTLRRSLTTIQRCLDQHLPETQALSTDPVLRLRLGRNGRMHWVRAGSLAPADGCITRSLRRTRFPTSTAGLLADVTLRLSA